MFAVTAAVLYWAWSLLPERKERPAPTEPAVPRVPYGPDQPLAFEVSANEGDAQVARVASWLRDEWGHWFARAPEIRHARNPAHPDQRPFVLQARLLLPEKPELQLRLVAPDGFIEREKTIPTQDIGLPFALTLTREIPRFLGLATDWTAVLGTSDPEAYDTVVRARDSLRTSPPSTSTGSAAQRLVADIDALEKVTRRDPQYARAWSTLALAYAHMEGEDSSSLDTLAVAAAERAVTLDPKAAEAHAVRGLVQYQRGQWLAAHTHLQQALQLEPDSAAALTALACLLVDAGRQAEALPIAERAVATAPANARAHECLTYARIATGHTVASNEATALPFAAARLVATIQILDGDVAAARQTYEAALTREQLPAQWLDAFLNAAVDRGQIVRALREITSAASAGQLDSTTEILAGVALKRADFVLNRLLRLQHANEHPPLRVLWLPQTVNLRKHGSFDDVLRKSNLTTFWSRHGKPDVCAQEPRIAPCR
jgi:tetratricopeptide (TPR) repeat protein